MIRLRKNRNRYFGCLEISLPSEQDCRALHHWRMKSSLRCDRAPYIEAIGTSFCMNPSRHLVGLGYLCYLGYGCVDFSDHDTYRRNRLAKANHREGAFGDAFDRGPNWRFVIVRSLPVHGG
jgi:hypothetical protein